MLPHNMEIVMRPQITVTSPDPMYNSIALITDTLR